MKISIGSDHRGFKLKEMLKKSFDVITWIDRGATDARRSDYPVFAKAVARDVSKGSAERGILICGSGVGMAITANRQKGVYAALCWNPAIARVAREDDGSNVLVLPADFISAAQARRIVHAWLTTHARAGRYRERLEMIDAKD